MKKNSNKRSSKKGLVPALLATLCSVGALTTVSYAWFTMGNEASVEQIDVNVQAADGMQIAVDAKSWKSFLPVADLAAVETNLLPGANTKLAPTSTDGTYVAGKQQMFLGTVEENGNISAKLETEKYKDDEGNALSAQNFIAFDFYVKLNKDSSFNLDAGSYVKDLVDDTHEDKDSSLASRVSFAYLGTAQNTTNALALGSEYAEKAVIWEPNHNHHTQTVKDGMGDLEEEEYEVPFDYKGVNREIEEGANISVYNESFTQFTKDSENLIRPSYTTEALGADTTDDETDDVPAWGTTESTYLFNLKSGISKIRVYVWLEGEDIDCENDISEGSFSIGLSFNKADTVLEGVELPETATLEAGQALDLATNANGVALPENTEVKYYVVTTNQESQEEETELTDGRLPADATGTVKIRAKVAYLDGDETKYYSDDCEVNISQPAESE